MSDWLSEMLKDAKLDDERLAPLADKIMAGDTEQWLMRSGWSRPDPEHGLRLRDGTPAEVQLIAPYYYLVPYTNLREAVLLELRAMEYALERHLTEQDIHLLIGDGRRVRKVTDA